MVFLKKSFEKRGFLTLSLFVFIMSSVILSGCTHPNSPLVSEHRSLDLSYIKDDVNLKNPPIYATLPFKGTHKFERGVEIVLSENINSGFSVSSWVINDLNSGLIFEVEASEYGLVMVDNYQVTARFSCFDDESCIDGFSCVDSLCVFNN